MTQTEQQRAARKFSQDWQGKGYEKGESQIKEQFSDKTITNFIDIYIPSTKVMIEQKSQDKDLRSPIKQSDGSLLMQSCQKLRSKAILAALFFTLYLYLLGRKELRKQC